MNSPIIIDENGLSDFRRDHLAPEALLRLVDDHVHALVRLAVGVGKSYAVDELLEHPRLYERFDSVVYAAPAWDILRERRIVRDPARCPFPTLLLRPRPRQLCGSLDAAWSDLERRACSTLAKDTLCPGCPARRAGSCDWPDQWKQIKDARLLLMPEQQLLLNRMLVPMLRSVADAGRVLVVLDEGRLVDANFEVTVHDDDIARFARVLDSLKQTPVRRRWRTSIGGLLAGCGLDGRLDFPASLFYDGLSIQETGVAMFGPKFQNVGYDLALLATSRPAERWREGRQLRFIGRPLLHCHVLALSASHTGAYAGDRLGGGRMASPFEHVVFRHSGTRIVNLRSRLGADRYFHHNRKQILDTIAVLVARNIRRGTSTLLVSRKKSKAGCASYLTERLRGWGFDVQFVCEKYTELPSAPRADVIPIVHYGILGVNDFTEYEAAYCINSYYISPHELSRAVQESTPAARRVTISIDSRPDQVRRARVVEGSDPAGVLAHTANIYLQKLELDPVIQAVGRVRFATKPREVVFFQMADLTPLVGAHEVVTSLAELRQRLDIPAGGDVDGHLDAVRLEEVLLAGGTVGQAAAAVGISERTAYRRLAEHRAARFPSNTFLRGDGSLLSPGGAA